MRSAKYYLVSSSCIAVLVFSNLALAAEGGGHEAPAAEEGAKGEGANGEGAPSAEVPSDVKTRAKLKEWVEVETKLTALRAKIDAQSGVVNGLISEKNHIVDKSEAAEVASRLSKAHKELQTMIVEYEEKRNLLKFRYPEKGLSKERSYERIEVKSVEEMETQLSTEGKFKKVMNKVRSQFPMENSKFDQAESSQGKVDPKKIQKKQVKELPVQKSNLTEPIVLSK